MIHCLSDRARSTEEIFALFISMTFAVDAFRDVVHGRSRGHHAHIDCIFENLSASLILTVQQL